MEFVLGEADGLASKRETLSERSQRIIGKPLEVPEDFDGIPPVKRATRPANRRDQVINAQR